MVNPDSRTASEVKFVIPGIASGGTGNLSNLSSHVRLAAQARPTPRTVTPVKLRGLIYACGIIYACKSFKKRKALISPLISP